jgi:hypothetical protein
VDTPARFEDGAPAGDAHATEPESASDARLPCTGPTAPNQHAEPPAARTSISARASPSGASRAGDRDTSVPPEAEPAAGLTSATSRFTATGTAKDIEEVSRRSSEPAPAEPAATPRGVAVARAEDGAASAGVSRTATAEETTTSGALFSALT